jgi:hypothetical protein
MPPREGATKEPARIDWDLWKQAQERQIQFIGCQMFATLTGEICEVSHRILHGSFRASLL